MAVILSLVIILRRGADAAGGFPSSREGSHPLVIAPRDYWYRRGALVFEMTGASLLYHQS